jgi:hypothetical protein
MATYCLFFPQSVIQFGSLRGCRSPVCNVKIASASNLVIDLACSSTLAAAERAQIWSMMASRRAARASCR